MAPLPKPATRTARYVIPLIALLTVGAGCHHGSSIPSEEAVSEDIVDATITIRVVNHSQLDATIYLLHDGVRDRLGTVTAATTNTFALRRRTFGSGDFTLVADPLGSSRTAASERLLVGSGTRFTWTLESDFANNSVQVQD